MCANSNRRHRIQGQMIDDGHALRRRPGAFADTLGLDAGFGRKISGASTSQTPQGKVNAFAQGHPPRRMTLGDERRDNQADRNPANSCELAARGAAELDGATATDIKAALDDETRRVPKWRRADYRGWTT